MILFGSFFEQLFWMLVMFSGAMAMLARWAVRSGAATSVASAAGKGLAQKALEAVLKKR